jgi:hypothetical protein
MLDRIGLGMYLEPRGVLSLVARALDEHSREALEEAA